MNERWMFDDPRNIAVITTKPILREGAPILRVTHDADDGAWQFLGAGDADPDDALVVALHRIVALDASVQDLADLPLGWHAWRDSTSAPWQRAENHAEEEPE